MNAFDVIIIGFGKGGKTLAAEFAKRGRKVAIVERSDKMYGGTCINIGCIPTKTLVHQAKIASGMKNSTFEERREFYRNAIAVKESVTSALRDKNYHNLADHPNVTVYTGVGSFVSADVVSVRTSTEEIWLTSKQIIINTGAETIIPPIEGYQYFNHGINRSSPSAGYCWRRLYWFRVCVYVCFVRFAGDGA